MKTKMYKLKEWNQLVDEGKVSEEDLKNGNPNFIPIECPKPKCRAKMSQPTLIDLNAVTVEIWCGVCLATAVRKVAR